MLEMMKKIAWSAARMVVLSVSKYSDLAAGLYERADHVTSLQRTTTTTTTTIASVALASVALAAAATTTTTTS